MIFTRRFLWLIALGAVPLTLSSLAPGLAYIGLMWDFVVAGFAIADYQLCPRPERILEAERVTDEALSVAISNSVALQIRSVSDRPFTALVRDEPPSEFVIGTGQNARVQSFRFMPRDLQTLEYEVTPPHRGDFSFGDVYVRITGPLGLIVRQGKLKATAPISVYPDLHAVEEYDRMLRRANQSPQGNRRVRITGGGREFASLREYTPDDEYRSIDWKATARRSRVMSRTYESERSQDILLLIDLGRLMRQEIDRTQKLDHVVSAALMLAHVAAAADDRVGLLTFADEVRAYLPPRRGKAQANAALHALYAARAEPIESDYRAAFRFLSSRWRKRSLAVLFTDLADAESSALLLREIAQLAWAHLVVCVVVRDPLIGSRSRGISENVSQVYEKAVALETLSDRSRALELLGKRGVLIVDAEPAELSASLVERYLAVKGRGML